MSHFYDGSVDSVPGFSAVGLACGIKQSGAPDLAVLVCDRPCAAAGVFTTNRVQAAPVLYTRSVLEKAADSVRAVVVNSGNANACTGQRGLDDAAFVAAEAEHALGLPPGTALVMSTGIIGRPLPVDRIAGGLARAASIMLSGGSADSFARAIMTTDTREKHLAVNFEIGRFPVTLGAAAKGSGMIHPEMATMLGFFATDAAVTAPALTSLLREVTADTFNMISVDGDRSPNDSVLVLASGASCAPLIEGPQSPGYRAFRDALFEAAGSLARMIVEDGEGATKFIEIRVRGAENLESARRVARAVANSPLVKTAFSGEDPNWGRIVSAAGCSGVPFDPARLDLYFQDLQAVSGGACAGVEEKLLAQALKDRRITLTIDLNQGQSECRFWTCDLSCEYIRINADYHT